MTQKTERLISNNCAPTILGIKPASLITVSKKDFNEFYKELFLINSNKNKFKVISLKKR